MFLIVDGHPVLHSRKVARWVAEHAGQVAPFRQPAYHPDLNPDAVLNQDVNSNARGRRRPPSQRNLGDDLPGYLYATQRRSRYVPSYFRHSFVAYAA